MKIVKRLEKDILVPFDDHSNFNQGNVPPPKDQGRWRARLGHEIEDCHQQYYQGPRQLAHEHHRLQKQITFREFTKSHQKS